MMFTIAVFLIIAFFQTTFKNQVLINLGLCYIYIYITNPLIKNNQQLPEIHFYIVL